MKRQGMEKMDYQWEQANTAEERMYSAEDEPAKGPALTGVQQWASNDDKGTSRHPAWDGELLDDVIKQFMEEIPGFMDRLQEALHARDMAFLQGAAYHLRGTTGLLQVRSLSGLAKSLEDCAKADDIVSACRVANELTLELQNLMDTLEEFA